MDVDAARGGEPRDWSSYRLASRDCRKAQTAEQGHGGAERRAIKVSTDLNGHLEPSCAEQAFKLERYFAPVTVGG